MVVPGKDVTKCNRVLVDQRCEHRTISGPPLANRFVADLDTTLVKQVFDVAQRQRKPNVEHHRKPDDFWAGFEIAEGGTPGHHAKLAKRHDRLKQSSSDTTLRPARPAGITGRGRGLDGLGGG